MNRTSAIKLNLLPFSKTSSKTCKFWGSKANYLLTIALFAAVNHLNGPLRKLQKVIVCDLWISIRFVTVFQGSLFVIVIMIDGSEKRNYEGGFWTLQFSSHVCEKRSKTFEVNLYLSIPRVYCFSMHYYIAHGTLETVLLESFLFQHVSVVRVIYSPSTNQVSWQKRQRLLSL